MQRLRIKFSRGSELKFISHLDIVRLWQRAFNRAGIEIAFSAGFSPHAKISLAAPLPLGVTGEAELMDIYVVRGVAPHYFISALNQQLPAGMSVSKVYPISSTLPSLQSQISFAEYQVKVDASKGPEDIGTAIKEILAAEHFPWQHQRDTGPHVYDLRSLIDDLWVIEWAQYQGMIGMKLRSDSQGSGRPEQVAFALGFTVRPLSIHRTQLFLKTG